MAETNPIDLLLNRDNTSQTVTAPAFSITKVISSAAIVLTPLAAYLAKAIGNVKFTPGQIVALLVAVLALLGITSASDVIARSIATRGQTEFSGYVPVDPTIKATWIRPGEDGVVDVVATRRVGDLAEYLVFEPSHPLTWVARKELKFGAPSA